MSEIVGVDHLIIAVRDLGAAEKTYTAIFGRAPSWKGIHPGVGTGNVLYRLANTYVELYAPVAEGANAEALRKRLDASGEGLYGVVFGLADAAAAATAFNARGLTSGAPLDGSGRDEISGATRKWRTVALPASQTRGLFLLGIQHLSPEDALPPAPLSEGVAEAEAVASCDHVVVMTPDAEACKTLFGTQLGIRLALDHTKPEWGVRQLFFRTGGVTVEVVEPLDREKAPKSERFWGVAWKVPDIAAAVARLEKAGLDVSEVRKGRKPGTEVATIRKPTAGVPTLLISQS
ncbi:VOC family protein [uncultured Parvibaculum sp.]|uniref:VOC family protein n=1 Tax=uncultured Parvibaculum sp. TaxID=291828 RepID=UPI0030DAE8FC|tara:strand:+ start:3903 stop:4772 length:870 start_codon:yes stop_codon:yes gene_type:complete